MLNKDKYNLPDIELLNRDEVGLNYIVWQPDKTYAVLGASNKADTSLNLPEINEDGVEVVQRPSGGEAVLLTPKTLVISFYQVSSDKINPKEYFHFINHIIVRALEAQGFTDLSVRGISDICIGEKKILGCSIYRYKHGIFYQSVLNVAEDPKLFSRYLKHPQREPDYRLGRNHHEFVTTLTKIEPTTDIETLQKKLEITITEQIKNSPKEDVNAV
jgi:lipoate-protein ligase A